MLRDKNLIPLSHQHQRALALCVRIDRASPIHDSDLNAWQMEIAQLFRSEIEAHFSAEERILFPKAQRFAELSGLVDEPSAEHVELRICFSSAEKRKMSVEDLSVFAQKLSAHIRKEERQLFEGMQGLMSQEELTRAGKQLEEAFKDAAQACTLPDAATRLRAAK